MKLQYPLAKQTGFTIIEIMIVVVIIGILAAIIAPKFAGRPEQARKVQARQDVTYIQSAMDLYKLDNGDYPTNEQGIAALVTEPNSEPAPTNWSQYLQRMPVDPWRHPYHYLNPGQHSEIDIFTYGKTNQFNEQDEIGNWKQ